MNKKTITPAQRRVLLRRLKKARRMRRYYTRCRRKLALTSKPFARPSVPFARPSMPSLGAAPTVPDFSGAGPFGGGRAPALNPRHNPWAVYSARYGDPRSGYDLETEDLSRYAAKQRLRGYPKAQPKAFGMYYGVGAAMPAMWGSEIPRSVILPNPNGGGLVGQIKAGDRVTFVDEGGGMRVGRAVMPSSHGGWVLNLGGRSGTPAVVDDTNIVRVSASRARASNPELLIVTNPGGRRRSRVNASMRVHGRRKQQMRRRRRSKRNLPLTIKSGGRRHTWKALVKKYGVMGAKKKWTRKKKYHGYTRTRIAANRRRRRKNSWKGQRRRHARAARKGWSRRRRRGGRRRASSRRRTRSYRRRGRRKLRRGGRVRYRGKLYSRAKLRRKIGKRRAAKLFHKRGKTANPRRRRSRRRKN